MRKAPIRCQNGCFCVATTITIPLPLGFLLIARVENGAKETASTSIIWRSTEIKRFLLKDVQALMAYGWEFAVKYKNCEAFISAFGQTFYIEAECDGKDYWWDAYTLEEFEDAMVGPYRLKDIVDKWEITEFC